MARSRKHEGGADCRQSRSDQLLLLLLLFDRVQASRRVILQGLGSALSDRDVDSVKAALEEFLVRGLLPALQQRVRQLHFQVQAQVPTQNLSTHFETACEGGQSWFVLLWAVLLALQHRVLQLDSHLLGS